MTDAASFDPDDLLAHLGWIRALANRLVQDAHAAEDLTQDTVRLALESWQRAPRGPHSLRAWLARVVRNQGLARYRSERARRQRERIHEVERSPVPSPPATLERAASQRHLIDTVLSLEEPYQSVILLRFFEELTPREIAQRTGVKPSTVATRTAEGLRRIRAKLAREGEGAWLPALIPLLDGRSPLPKTLWNGAVTVGVIAKTALILGVVSAGWWALSPGASQQLVPAEQESGFEPEFDVLAELAVDLEQGLSIESDVRLPALESSLEVATPPQKPTSERMGRVVDERGAGVPGVEVTYEHRVPFDIEADHHAGVLRPQADRVLADAQGRFVLRGEPPMTVFVEDPRYVMLYKGHWFSDDDREPTVVVSRQVPLAGQVVDDRGQPVVGAALHLILPTADLPDGAYSSQPLWTSTDEAGAFAFESAPALDDLHLHVAAMGFAHHSEPLKRGGDPNLTIRLSRAAFEGFTVQGHVSLPDGEPAVGAWVSSGGQVVQSDAEGAYLLSWELPPGRPPSVVQAVFPKYAPAVWPLPEHDDVRHYVDVNLNLAEGLTALSGRVVDGAGQPLAGVSVELLGRTPFGLLRDPQQGWYQQRSVEELSGTSSTSTDAEGSFELSGLPGYSYEIQASRWKDAAGVVSEPVEAGATNLTLVLDVGTAELVGRVVDLRGQPVAGVQLRPTRKRGDGGFSIANLSVVSEVDGSFCLKETPRALQALRLEGQGIVPDIFHEVIWEGDEIEVTVARRCELRVDWGAERNTGWSLSLLDQDEQAQTMLTVRGGGISIRSAAQPPPAGDSIFAVRRTAAWAVLRQGEQEITRYPLRLDPDWTAVLKL